MAEASTLLPRCLCTRRKGSKGTYTEVAEKLMCSGRVVDGGLQTAVQEYRHPNGRSILMVGCVHVAEPDYYTQIRKIVDEAEASGATVLLEGKPVRDDNADDASKEELAAMRASTEALRTAYEHLPALLDIPWVYQNRSALAPYPDTWQGSDAPELDLIRLVGVPNAHGMAPSVGTYERLRQLKDSKGPDSVTYLWARGKWAHSYIYEFKRWNWAQRLISRSACRARRTINRVTRMFTRKPVPARDGWMRPYMWTYRECIAAQRALGIGGDVVMLWHPGHMLGIGQILMQNGFEPQEPQRWLIACHKIELLPENKTNKRRRNTGVKTGEDKGFTRGDAE